MSLEALKPSDLMQIDVLSVGRTGFNANHPDWGAVRDIANRAFEYGGGQRWYMAL
jgi:hypothetical protein